MANSLDEIKINLWTKIFIQIFKNKLYEAGIPEKSDAERMILNCLRESMLDFSQTVKKGNVNG